MARTTVTFATSNLYNINLPGLAMYSNETGWSQEAYDKKVAWTGSMLARMPSDAWGFQELWHRQALVDVFKEAGLQSKYKLLVPPGHAGGHITCAGAVKKGLIVGDPEWITDFPPKFVMRSKGDDDQTAAISVTVDKFSRPVLRFSIRPRQNGKPITVYVVHLKSKMPTQVYREPWYNDDKPYYKKHSTAIGAAIATIRRSAEAAALRMMLTDEIKNNDNPVVVLGDCNDGQHSNTINILTGQPNYLMGLSTGGSDTGLYTVGTLQEYRSLRDVYYTHCHGEVRESLDHILVSQEFYDNSKKRLWAFKGMEIANDHLNTDDHKEDGTSDHGIVRATFEYRPA